MLMHCLNEFQSHVMSKEAVNTCLSLLKFLPDWFVMNKILKDLDDAVFFNDNIVFVNADPDNVTFFSNDMGLVNVDLNIVSLDDNNSVNDDPETIIHIRLFGVTDINNASHAKKR